jgi:hypothetical protein
MDQNKSKQNEISSQHEEIDSRLFNFLMRRIKKEIRNIHQGFGTNYEFEDFEPLNVTEYTFEEFPSYGFNTFNNKKQMEYKIVEMLVEETDLVGDWFFGPENVNNPERQKFMRTIRKFLNFILTD